MTEFFIPGITGDAAGVEHVYARMRRQTELEVGRRPTPRRILSVWTRQGTVDCLTEVGRHDALRGGIVIAIFDLGAHQPFVAWWQLTAGRGDRIPEVLDRDPYSVLEFDA